MVSFFQRMIENKKYNSYKCQLVKIIIEYVYLKNLDQKYIFVKIYEMKI